MARLRSSGEGYFSQGLALSLGLHGLLTALVLWGGGFKKPAAPLLLTVSLVAPGPEAVGPLASPGQGGAAAPSPPRVPAALEGRPAAPPSPKKQPRRLPPPSPPQPEPDLARPMPLTPPMPAASPPASLPSLGAAPGSTSGAAGQTAAQGRTGSGAGAPTSAVLGFGQGGAGRGSDPSRAQSDYLKLVRGRILAKREYPYLARQRHQEGVVRLRFTLSAAGTLAQGVQVVKPSGFQILDDQARQCVLAAAPFPPFPAELPRDQLTLEVPIVYELKEGEF